MKILKITIIALILLNIGCKQNTQVGLKNNSSNNIKRIEKKSKKIQILNFGTFHFGYTSDANAINFDEHDIENQREAHKIAEKLSEFQPTVILVETIPQRNEKLQNEYRAYITNPKMNFESPTEIELLAYELGRISGVERIYGIDHKMEYNYNIGNEIENNIDSIWYNKFYKNPLSFYTDVYVKKDNYGLFDRLKQVNRNQFLDFLIAVNADMLTHVGTKDGFEGADEAAKYYQRNLRMYSNLNRLKLNEDDRVFILMGASHVAFFRDFISRSPKYEMVNTFKYLK